ncbi:hypothetical protein DL546_007815 [Coniochaeta pulveracea]|uniref:PRKR-interacting protein 1 n=1 Tax=Coniochaeta pulveracea TaxID=177199 RepID=A0A420YHP1_9PEZI|nr:hypothetical protein DL546_007815 [Coniochaeta pulveracea]
MSAGTADSIPTSSDPRSKRPTKRRALTPVSAQAATVESLFARPDQEIRLPASGATTVAQRAVPEIVTNVQGSSAGAGSGEFHVYKASRRREYERLRAMDEEVRNEKEEEEFERIRREKEERDAEKTRKNREKREKKLKAKMGKGKGSGKAGEGGGEKKGQDGQETNGTPKPAGTPAVSDGPGLLIRDDDD